MLAIIYFLLGGLIMNGERIIFDFSSEQTAGKWRTINDVVMGGLSKSNMVLNEDGFANFSGTLSK